MTTNNSSNSQRSYGIVQLSNLGTGIPFSFTTSYQQISGLSISWVLQQNNNFSMSTDGEMKYTGVSGASFLVQGYMSTQSASTYDLLVGINGSTMVVPSPTGYSHLDQSVLTTTLLFGLNNGDYLSLFVKRAISGADNLINVWMSATQF